MDKQGKAPKKAKPTPPAATPAAPGWPTQGTNAGIKQASAVHGRKPSGKGAVRGR